MFPAFKEWHAIVGALAAGEQTLILRKGGIAEARGGFRPRGEPFWLLPTLFHEQADKLSPRAKPHLPTPSGREPDRVDLTCWAELHHHAFLANWGDVQRLAPHHLWTEPTVRERFNWGPAAGLHLLIVRVHRLREPIPFALTAAQQGCKSWVDVPLDPTTHGSSPALDESAFRSACAALAIPSP